MDLHVCCDVALTVLKQEHFRVNMKKHSEETQTLRAGCSKAELKNFAPPQTPLPGCRTTKI